MEDMESDLINGAIIYGPTNFSIILYKYNIISSFSFKLINRLSKLLSPRNVSVVLVEILANNIKDELIFKNFIHILENSSPLHYLYQKIGIIYG